MGAGAAEIDLGKLRACLRSLRDEDVFLMLDEAIERLSPGDLEQVVRPYLTLERLRRKATTVEPEGLAACVRAFADATRAGEYYESFEVDSRNFTRLSRGTLAWISTFRRLIDRCVVEIGREDPSEVVAAMGVLFGLLELIDECGDDVLFFADEGGSWQVGVDWRQVLPAWLRVLSESTGPRDFAAAVVERHRRLPSHVREVLLELADRMATPVQGAALAARIAAEARGSRGVP